MSLYGSTIPRKGRELFAKILATSKPLTITRVMMGQGICPDTIFPGDLEDLIQPVAAVSSSDMIMPPLGPRRVLWVVVVVT